jgi:hypothetical protein
MPRFFMASPILSQESALFDSDRHIPKKVANTNDGAMVSMQSGKTGTFCRDNMTTNDVALMQ